MHSVVNVALCYDDRLGLLPDSRADILDGCVCSMQHTLLAGQLMDLNCVSCSDEDVVELEVG